MDYLAIGAVRLTAALAGVDAARAAALTGDWGGTRVGLAAFWDAMGRDYQDLDSADDAAHVDRVLDEMAGDARFRGELAELRDVWGEDAPATPQGLLHAALEELRGDLADALGTPRS